jgi:hypothetical protein
MLISVVKKGHTCSLIRCTDVKNCEMPHKHKYTVVHQDQNLTIDLVNEGQKEVQELIKRKAEDSKTALCFLNEFSDLAAKYFDVAQTAAGRAAVAPIATKAYAQLRGISSSANRNGGIPEPPMDSKRAKIHADFQVSTPPLSSPAGPSSSSPPGPEQKTPEARAPCPAFEDTLQRQSTF